MAASGLFSRVFNKKHKLYKILKKKDKLNISTSPKKKKILIYKVLQLFYTIFHILQLLHDNFIINPISYIYFNVHSQAIIYPLIFPLIDLFKIC